MAHHSGHNAQRDGQATVEHHPTLQRHKHHRHRGCQQQDKAQYRAVNIGNMPPPLRNWYKAQPGGRHLHKDYRQYHQQNGQHQARYPHALAGITPLYDKLQHSHSRHQHHGHGKRHNPYRRHADYGNHGKENGGTAFSVGIAGSRKGRKEEDALYAYRRTVQGNKRQPHSRNNAKRNPRLATPSLRHNGGKQRHQPQQQRLYHHAH